MFADDRGEAGNGRIKGRVSYRAIDKQSHTSTVTSQALTPLPRGQQAVSERVKP